MGFADDHRGRDDHPGRHPGRDDHRGPAVPGGGPADRSEATGRPRKENV